MSMPSTLPPPSSASSKRIVFGWELGKEKNGQHIEGTRIAFRSASDTWAWAHDLAMKKIDITFVPYCCSFGVAGLF
jgi:hypothetical protein